MTSATDRRAGTGCVDIEPLPRIIHERSVASGCRDPFPLTINARGASMEPSHPRPDSAPIHVVFAPRSRAALMNYPRKLTYGQPLQVDEPELALPPLDHDDVTLRQPPMPLRRERENAAHTLVLLDRRLQPRAQL